MKNESRYRSRQDESIHINYRSRSRSPNKSRRRDDYDSKYSRNTYNRRRKESDSPRRRRRSSSSSSSRRKEKKLKESKKDVEQEGEVKNMNKIIDFHKMRQELRNRSRSNSALRAMKVSLIFI